MISISLDNITQNLFETKFADKWQNKRRIFAAFLLIFMSFQYVWLEGFPLSWPKVICMVLSPLILLYLHTTRFSIAFGWGFAYWLTIWATSLINGYRINYMSLIFTLPFILMFGSYHTLLTYKVFKLKDIENIFLLVMKMYIYCLILQQICYFIGIHKLMLINRWVALGFKFQSLALEPSYAARIFCPFAFGYLEILRYKYKKNLSLKFLWKNYKWEMLGIVYFLTTLGSGSGWACLGFLGIYISWHGQKLLAIIALYVITQIPADQIEAMDRVRNTISSTMTFDFDNVVDADHSAAMRISGFFNFVENFKPHTWIFWFGQGQYKWIQPNIGIIKIYGFIAWIVQLTLFRVCAFRKFLSLEFLYFVILLVMCVGNVVNQWAIMMVFATIKYVYSKKIPLD